MTNHALEIADEAVWRRMKFFVFDHSWEEGGRDPGAAQGADPGPRGAAAGAELDAGPEREAWADEGWGDVTIWNEARDDERGKHDTKERWLRSCVVITGLRSDTFSHADVLAAYTGWLAYNGEDPDPMSRSMIRDELESRLGKIGVKYDRLGKVFAGGRLL